MKAGLHGTEGDGDRRANPEGRSLTRSLTFIDLDHSFTNSDMQDKTSRGADSKTRANSGDRAGSTERREKSTGEASRQV